MLLADEFEFFRNECLKNYELDLAHFLTALGLAWQTCLKGSRVKLELLTDPDMLLMVESGIRGGICEAKLHYPELNVYMKHHDESNKSSYLQYYDANSLYTWAMTQKLLVDGFKFKKNILKFTKDFITNYDEDSDKRYILEVDLEYLKKLHDLHSDLLLLPERMKINKCSKLVSNLCDKKTMLFI